MQRPHIYVLHLYLLNINLTFYIRKHYIHQILHEHFSLYLQATYGTGT